MRLLVYSSASIEKSVSTIRQTGTDKRGALTDFRSNIASPRKKNMFASKGCNGRRAVLGDRGKWSRMSAGIEPLSGNQTETAHSSGSQLNRFKRPTEEAIAADGNVAHESSDEPKPSNGNKSSDCKPSTAETCSAFSASLSSSIVGHKRSGSSSSTSDESSSYHDEELDEEMLSSVQKMRVDRRPMLPCEFSNIEEAMQHFVTVFEARYGAIHPTFHKGSLHDAIRDAFEAPGRPITDRRPLAVYLRDDNAVGSNIFANNVLCSDAVCSLLNASFVTWSWDVTLVGNKNSLIEWIDACRIQSIKPRMGRICNEQYPLLIVLTKKRGAIHCIDIACGYDSVEQVLAKLKSAIADYELVKNAEVVEQKCRIEREVLRREQEREYEFSKAQDRTRREELQRQKQKQEDEESRRKDDEARKRRAEEEKERRNKQLAESLPSEPASTDKDVLTVRIRFPEGNTAVRRFRRNEPLQHLVTFVESKGYDLHRHKILTSDVPRRDMMQCYQLNRTFAELKLSSREQVIVDEI